MRRSGVIAILSSRSPGVGRVERKWDQRFEFSFLHRRVSCEPDFRLGGQQGRPQHRSQSGCKPSQAVMIGDRLDNDIRPARLLSWKTIRIAQDFARFQSPRDSLDEADLTLANVKLVVPVFTGDLAKSS